MERRSKLIVGGVLAAVLVTIGAGIAIAGGEDDAEGRDVPITGAAFDRARAAALQHTGGGRVTGSEVGDEESYYEVEVTRDDGSQVDVQLDESFRIVGDEEETPAPGEEAD
jgi:uncharacterized membrane protein YkoI